MLIRHERHWYGLLIYFRNREYSLLISLICVKWVFLTSFVCPSWVFHEQRSEHTQRRTVPKEWNWDAKDRCIFIYLNTLKLPSTRKQWNLKNCSRTVWTYTSITNVSWTSIIRISWTWLYLFRDRSRYDLFCLSHHWYPFSVQIRFFRLRECEHIGGSWIVASLGSLLIGQICTNAHVTIAAGEQN